MVVDQSHPFFPCKSMFADQSHTFMILLDAYYMEELIFLFILYLLFDFYLFLYFYFYKEKHFLT